MNWQKNYLQIFDKDEEKWFVNILEWIDSLYKMVYKAIKNSD